jgi:hypothetical protein
VGPDDRLLAAFLLIGGTQTTGFFKRPAQQKLYLSIQAAQVVIGPPLEALEKIRVEPNQKWFTLCHNYW